MSITVNVHEAKTHLSRLLEQAHAGQEIILAKAGKLGCDLIVMASHPPDDLRTFLVGSYADKVVRHSEIPVLVVR